MHSSKTNNRAGFTIVELLIVIIVIGILAAIVIISFNGLQNRAIDSTLASELGSASRAMHVAAVDTGVFPSALPSNVHPNAKVSLALKATSSGAVYGILNPSQNGLLFHDICNQMVSEGIGSRSDGNNYISGCQVFNKNQLHVNGWNGRDINTNITTASLTSYVSSYSGGSAALFTTNATDFMNQWTSRFQAAGGTFPVTLFWDSWATSTNGGVMKPSMPTPISTGTDMSGTAYCIEATYAGTSKLWHITQATSPVEGPCS